MIVVVGDCQKARAYVRFSISKLQGHCMEVIADAHRVTHVQNRSHANIHA